MTGKKWPCPPLISEKNRTGNTETIKINLTNFRFVYDFAIEFRSVELTDVQLAFVNVQLIPVCSIAFNNAQFLLVAFGSIQFCGKTFAL